MSDDRIPNHLSSPSRGWITSVISEVDDITETELRLLIKGAEAHDRADTARRRLDRDGILIQDRFGQLKTHPAVQIERDARAAFARIVAQLGLDTQESGPPAGSTYRGRNGRTYRR